MPNLKTLARAINLAHREIEEASRDIFHKACVIGRHLLAAKKLVGHGNWLEWQKQNLKFSIRTAQVYMSIVKHENDWKNADSAHLTLQKVLHLINPSPPLFDKDHGGDIGGRSPFRLCDSFEHIQSDSWGTPANIIKLVKAMYGGIIPLDVCSSDWHQQTIRAKRHFTPKDNGLRQNWCDGSFGNIPYSNPAPWIEKAIAEERLGVDGIIILVHSNTSTKWFDLAWQACSAVCFGRGNMKFTHPTRTKITTSPVGSAFFYFGGNPTKFGRIFSQVGNAAINTWATKEAKDLKLRAVA
jgi:phage N-6-adenine-methyltransferase